MEAVNGNTISVVSGGMSGTAVHFTASRAASFDTTAAPCWLYDTVDTNNDPIVESDYTEREPDGYIISSNNTSVTVAKTALTSANYAKTVIVGDSCEVYKFNDFGIKPYGKDTVFSEGWNTMTPLDYTDDVPLDIFGIYETSVSSSNIFVGGTTVAADAVTQASSGANFGVPAGLPAVFSGASACVPTMRNGFQILAMKPALGGIQNHYSSFRCRQFYKDPDEQTT